MKILLAIGVLVLGISGCAQEKEEEEGVFDPLVNTLDRAEAVQDIGLEHKNQLDEALEEAEGQRSQDPQD